MLSSIRLEVKADFCVFARYQISIAARQVLLQLDSGRYDTAEKCCDSDF